MAKSYFEVNEQENIPAKLARLLEVFRAIRDPADRIMTLIEFAGQYLDPPASVAQRPFPAANRIRGARDPIYLWAAPDEEKNLRYYFCVEHADGISTRALAVILQETLSGAPLNAVSNVSPSIVDTIFGVELSAERRETLRAMVEAVRDTARRRWETTQKMHLN